MCLQEQRRAEVAACHYDWRNGNGILREDESREEDRNPDMKYEFYPEGSGEPLKDLKGRRGRGHI